MQYTGWAVLPHDNAERAQSALRARLQQMAAADNTSPDWTTLSLAGPTEVRDARGNAWFEWVATVEALAEPATEAARDATDRPTVNDLGLLKRRKSA